jgi:hypothetical protein
MVVCESRSKLMQYNKSRVQYAKEKAESQSDGKKIATDADLCLFPTASRL